MKKLTRYLIAAAMMTACAHGVELRTLEHKVLDDKRTYIRDDTDRRYSIWTADPGKAIKLLKDFGFSAPDFQLREGEVLAVFMNDNITQDLIQVVHNKTANKTFADYADSGIEFKLVALEEGKKYSHVTAVVFTPIGTPGHLGIRGMVADGLSEKR
jgi:hypothetical protein